MFDFQEEETPLHCASARGNLDCVKILLDHGADLNVMDKVSSQGHRHCHRESWQSPDSIPVKVKFGVKVTL